MARQRMIKPTFFEDLKIGKLSHSARMLYIGMWVFADDWGVIKGSIPLLKGWIFPFDDISNSQMIEIIGELEAIERIQKFETNGESYFYIPKFNCHQKINRPSETIKNPDPPKELIEPKNEDLTRAHGGLMEGSWRAHGGLTAQAEEAEEAEEAESTARKQSTKLQSASTHNGKIEIEDLENILLPLPFEKTESALESILTKHECSDHPKADGNRKKTIKKIMAAQSEILIRQKLRHFLWAMTHKPKLCNSNPGGYLIQSIQKRYPPPAGYDEWLDREKTNHRKRNQGIASRDPTEDKEIQDLIAKSLSAVN
jgi:hypothetical protein